MGKKVLSGALKVATLGAAGPGGWGSKAIGALTGGLAGENVYGSGNPLNGISGENARLAAEAQQKQAAQLAAQQAVISENATALQSNSTVDNTVSAIAGGSADAAAAMGSDFRRKRGGSVASQLGV